MGHVVAAVGEWVAAMLTLLALVAASGVALWLADRNGYRRGRRDRGRARVRAAVEAAGSETVVIPRPRQEVGR